jgi:hypothetical protein
MASLDSLTDPQRATLQLLLKRGKSYAEIAELLKLDTGAVQSRAQDAVSALGPDTPQIGADHRGEIADFLLGQQSASRRAATREYLEDSADGRAWARAVAAALRPLAGDGGLPDIPSEPAEVDQAFEALDRRMERQQQVASSSVLGGRIFFGALGLLVAVGLIIAFGIIPSDDPKDPATSTVVRTSAAPNETPEVIAQGVLKPPRGSSSKANGETGIVRYVTAGQYKLLVAAKKLDPAPAAHAYGVWLYTSPSDALFVGFPKAAVSSKGELNVVAPLSPDTRNYREVLLTQETIEKPQKPGKIVLRGALLVRAAPQQGQTQTQTQTTG